MINALVVRDGLTVIVRGSASCRRWAEIDMTLEALAYGAMLGPARR